MPKNIKNPDSNPAKKTGLVLTGGGARAAYQVGALKAISEILKASESPYSVYSGVSAGAINSTSLACGADRHMEALSGLVQTWKELSPDKVYKTDARTMIGIGSRWLKDLSTGGIFGSGEMNFLLDTSPLKRLIEEKISTHRLPDMIRQKKVHGVAVTATNYVTGTAITFFDADPSVQTWNRSTRIGVRQELLHENILASTAIPVFFPPVEIGGIHYGDGCVRMSAPISPAIHLGADRIVAIGIRSQRSVQETIEMNLHMKQDRLAMSDIAGVILNAIFLDSLESDLERHERINATLSLMTPEQLAKHPNQLRPIPVLSLRPSKDLGKLAADQYKQFPAMLRHVLKGIGAAGESGWDLISYLAFEPVYVSKLMELGYEDTLARRYEVEEFFG